MIVLDRKNEDTELAEWIEFLQKYFNEPYSGTKAVRKAIKYFVNEVPKLKEKNEWYFNEYEKLTTELSNVKSTLINFTNLLNQNNHE